MKIKFERSLFLCGGNWNSLAVVIPQEVCKAFELQKKQKVKMFVNDKNNLEIELVN